MLHSKCIHSRLRFLLFISQFFWIGVTEFEWWLWKWQHFRDISSLFRTLHKTTNDFKWLKILFQHFECVLVPEYSICDSGQFFLLLLKIYRASDNKSLSVSPKCSTLAKVHFKLEKLHRFKCIAVVKLWILHIKLVQTSTLHHKPIDVWIRTYLATWKTSNGWRSGLANWIKDVSIHWIRQIARISWYEGEFYIILVKIYLSNECLKFQQ